MSTPKSRGHLHAHFRKRLAERFGLPFSKQDRHDAIRQIQSGDAKFMGRQSNSRTRWIVTIRGEEIPVIYDKIRHGLATALRHEWAEQEWSE